MQKRERKTTSSGIGQGGIATFFTSRCKQRRTQDSPTQSVKQVKHWGFNKHEGNISSKGDLQTCEALVLIKET